MEIEEVNESISLNDSETMETEGSPQSNNTVERVQKSRDPNKFPITRIRTIMKMDPDLTIASQESVYLITKAAVSYFLYYINFVSSDGYF